jgi:hypothetical protein
VGGGGGGRAIQLYCNENGLDRSEIVHIHKEFFRVVVNIVDSLEWELMLGHWRDR